MTNYYDNVYINSKYTFLGSDYLKPIIINDVNLFKNDYYMNMKSIEQCEYKYQELCIKGILNKNRLKEKDISLLISSDLQNQNFASNYCASFINIPFLGIYSACASFCEGLIIASNLVKNNKIIITTSSHNLVSEKQFRFPVEYGCVRKMTNTLTVSGAVSTLVSNEKSNIRVESSTIGRVIKTLHKDSNDMGSAMAPSCAYVINKHLKDTKRTHDYYDLILTGDLGEYGKKIMIEYYYKAYKKHLNNVIDSGEIFYSKKNIYAGASGPATLPLILFDHILKSKKYKRILIVSTGSLHSVTSVNQCLEMPGISHAVSLEVL